MKNPFSKNATSRMAGSFKMKGLTFDTQLN